MTTPLILSLLLPLPASAQPAPSLDDAHLMTCTLYDNEKLRSPQGEPVPGGSDYLINALGADAVAFEKLPKAMSACFTTFKDLPEKRDDDVLCSDKLHEILARETEAIRYIQAAVEAKLPAWENEIAAAKVRNDQAALTQLAIRLELARSGVQDLLHTQFSVFDFSPPEGMRQPYLEKDGLMPAADAAREKLSAALDRVIAQTGVRAPELCRWTTPEGKDLPQAPAEGPSRPRDTIEL